MVALDDGFTTMGYDSRIVTPTHTGGRRRLMPQIPTKRSASRQSSLNENDINSYDGFRTPETTISQHRGASLPPTPTKSTKLLTRIMNQAKNSNSLPPTPGRQLPKPNLNHHHHRSAKARHNNLMTRTNSADYADNINDGYDNYYMRPGAMSASEYNEDYNYAYQSIDNLQMHSGDLIQDDNNIIKHVQSDNNKTSVVSSFISKIGNSISANIPSFIPQQQQQQQQQEKTQIIDDYYYNAQDDYYNNSKDISPRRGTKQKNQNSIESRDGDDMMSESYETALSSISNSMYQIKNNAQYMPDYQTTTSQIVNNSTQKTTSCSVMTSQYQRDHQMIPKAIETTTPSSSSSQVLPSVTAVAQVHINQNSTINKTTINRGYLKQQESIDNSYYPPAEIPQERTTSFPEEEEYNDEYNTDDNYLETQESIESYVEEDATIPDYNNKAINNSHAADSPSSVIHVENYDDEHSLRRGSSQITVVDPYHPALQRSRRPSATDIFQNQQQQQQQQRRLSGGEAYQSFDNDMLSRKPSLGEGGQRRASIRHSPTPPEHDDIIHEEVVDEEEEEEEPQEKKSVSFEEDEEQHAGVQQQDIRPKITAQQRWLWAYNKIIMQLNVSRTSFFFYLVLFFQFNTVL